MKIAETLLSRHPNHGETLSVKALLMLCLEPTREDEIVEVAKRGLRNGINSYLCWYSLGVVYRHIKRYKDAVKCFVMAFKLDPHNDRLLREICCLEIELNDYSGFRKYASVQLKLKSKEYREWVIFAFSQHLCGNLAISCEILEEADKLFMGSYRVDDLELSESIMYRAMLYEHLGEFNKCTDLLTTKSYQLKDKVTYLELLAKCYYFGNHPTEAHETYKKLIQMCPGNVRFVLLYFLTHPNVKIRTLFHYSHCYTKPLRGSIYQEKLLTDAQILTDSEKLITESEKLTEGKKLTHGENPIDAKNPIESEKLNPITDDTPDETCVYMLSDEIFDLDGEYSSGGWMLESKLHHSFDRYVRRMNMRNNLNYRNSHTFPQFMYKVVKNLDLRSLPTPDKILSVDELIKVINCYLDPTPMANCVPYCKYRKFLKRDSYPLVFQLRQLSQYEELLLLEQLDAMNLKDRFVFAMLEFLFSSDENFHARAEKYIKQSIRDGKVNILKSFTHALTFKKAYILLYLTHNLRESVDSANGEERISQNYQKVLVTLLLAQLYDYLGAYSSALEIVNEGFRITNTSPDLLCLRGKINRHLGDLRSSCDDYCVAGDLDRSDRQTSAKCAKAILRTNEFSLAQKKWKSFLTEDVCHRNDKDTPPEIPSFKFLLLHATLLYQLHQHHILATLFKGNHTSVTQCESVAHCDSVTQCDNVDDNEKWLKESFGVYKNVLERHMEIYVNQLDFHNYCLNRLSYRVYYNFLKLRNQHCNQGYFIKALKGLIRTALELFHSTNITTGDNSDSDNNDVVVYCVNKMRMVLCQRVFDPGLYHLFYELAEMRGMSVLFKLQCIMRCYYSARCDKYNPHLTQLIHHFLTHNTKFTHFEATLTNKMLRICTPNKIRVGNSGTVECTVECSVVGTELAEDYVNNVLEYVLSERYEYKGVMALVFMGYNYREKSFLELLFLNVNSLYEGINFRDFLKIKKLLSKAIYTCNNLNNQLFLKLQLDQLIKLFPN